MESNNRIRIRSVSAKFRVLFGALIFIKPMSDLLYWLSFNHLPAGFNNELPVTVTEPLSTSTLIFAFLISLIPTSIIIYGLINLKNLFALYEKGVVFTQKNVQCFRHIGLALIALIFANLVHGALLSVVLTINNPVGERILSLTFGSEDFSVLIMGAMIILVSWVMNEAASLEHEQAHTV